MNVEAKLIYEFGPFRVDTSERVLLREGSPVPLTPKAFGVLLMLVENNGRIIEKDEMMDQVWADSFVEEGNLKATVAMVRKALGEAAGPRRYIETIPRRGYRFRAEVTQFRSTDQNLIVAERTRSVVTIEQEEIHTPEDNGNQAFVRRDEDALRVILNTEFATAAPRSEGIADSRTAGQSQLSEKVKVSRRAELLLLAGGAVLLAGIAIWLYQSSRHHPAAFLTSLKVSKLTNDGNAKYAAISPDGKYLAEVTEEGGVQSLLVKLVATDNSIQIIPPAPVEYKGLVFSPDANFIFYTAILNGEARAGLYQVSAIGGPPKKLKENVDSPPGFSPGGKQFAFVREAKEAGVSSLIIASLESDEERRLVSRLLPEFLDYPDWSPDGQIIVCTVVSAGGKQVSLIQVNVKDGTEKPLTSSAWPYIVQPRWLRDGSGLVMCARDYAPRHFQLWHLSYPNGEARRITDDYNNYEGVSLTADATRLVAAQKNLMTTVWTCAIEEPDSLQQINDTAGTFVSPVWTRSGKIIYSLAGNEKGHLWMMNADGSDRRQLTFGDADDSAPALTPDGRTIVFVSDRSDSINIWRCDSDGSNVKQLTYGKGELSPQCSADGKWVFYISANKTFPTLWKVPLDGGEAFRLTDHPAKSVAVSSDGTLLAYLSTESSISEEGPLTITMISAASGETQKTLHLPTSFVQARDLRWTPDGQAFVLVAKRDGALNIWLQRLDGQPPKAITNFRQNRLLTFGLSSDGRIVFSRGSSANDVVLISGLR